MSVVSTFARSNVERLIMLRTSAVAVSCCRASFSSLVSRATFDSPRAADELLGSSAFDVTRLLRTPVLRRCAFAGSSLALERRFIASPSLSTRHAGVSSRAHLKGSGSIDARAVLSGRAMSRLGLLVVPALAYSSYLATYRLGRKIQGA